MCGLNKILLVLCNSGHEFVCYLLQVGGRKEGRRGFQLYGDTGGRLPVGRAESGETKWMKQLAHFINTITK